MSVRIAILGYLSESDHHGYELKKKIENQMKGWADVKFGSIYYALGKLTDEKLVAEVRSEKEAGKPARTIYRITPTGRRELHARLVDILANPKRIYLPYDIGVFFSKHLDHDQFLSLLGNRLDELNELNKELLGLRRFLRNNEKTPEVAEILVSHGLMHLNAERKWISDLKQRASRHDIFSTTKSKNRGEQK